jgi:hypothetical protein
MQIVDLVVVDVKQRPRACAREVSGGRSFLTVVADASDGAYLAASVREPIFRVSRTPSAASQSH